MKASLLQTILSAAGSVVIACGLTLATLAPQTVEAVPAEIAYQAQLLDSFTGQPVVSTDVNVTLRMYPSAVSSIPLDTQTFPNLDLSNSEGYVNLAVDTTGWNLNADVWVEVTVDNNLDSQPAETLLPRQKLNSVPFALNAAKLEGDSLAAVRAYADNAATTEAAQALSNAQAYTDVAAAAAEAAANVYTDAQIAALPPGGGGDLTHVENFNRVVFVNPAATQSATPDGTLADPFASLTDAYAFAKAMPGAGSYFDRIVIYLMPGQHNLASTLEMDTVGVDLVGFGNRTAFIRGTADPLLRFTAGTSGPWIRNLNIQPSAAANQCLVAEGGGRLRDVQLSRPTSAGPTQGTLMTINILPENGGNTFSFSINKFEIYGDVNITEYGDQTTFSEGFILGSVTSTGGVHYPAEPEYLSFNNISGIGSLDFQPSTGGGILILGGVQAIGAINWDINTLLFCNNVALIDPNLASPATLVVPQPASGSVIANTIGHGFSGWAGPMQSAGNLDVAPFGYIAFLMAP